MQVQAKADSKLGCKHQKGKGFHERYMAICKADNIPAAAELKPKKANEIRTLDFYGDRLRPYDWIAMSSALEADSALIVLGIRLRKNKGFILNDVDTLKKVKALSDQPVILSKYLFDELIAALQKFLQNNEILEELSLEGLPLDSNYLPLVVSQLPENTSITKLNLSRTFIGDQGCEILCSVIKHLPNIATIMLSSCELGVRGAKAIAEFIKLQKINRTSDAWAASLRYRNAKCIDKGLQKIVLNNNPMMGDEGLKLITDELREDSWIVAVEMRYCGLTEVAADDILNCLECNDVIKSFDVNHNPKLPEYLVRRIQMHFHVGSKKVSSVSSSSENNLSSIYADPEDRKYLEIQLEVAKIDLKEKDKLFNELVEEYLILDEELKKLKSETNQVPPGFIQIKEETLESVLAEKDKEIESLKSNLAEKDKEIESLKIVKEAKEMESIESVKEAKELESIKSVKDAEEMESIESILAEKDREIESIKSVKEAEEMESIESVKDAETETETQVSSTPEEKAPFIEKNIGDFFHNKENENDSVTNIRSKMTDQEVLDYFFQKNSD